MRHFYSIVVLYTVFAGVTFWSSTSFACTVTPSQFGAVGDGVTDDSHAVQRAFSSGCKVDGIGREYKVSKNLYLKSTPELFNASFVQYAVGPSVRTLVKNGGSIKIKGVKVNRGSFERNGSISGAAGIYLRNISNSTLEDVEVTGDGYGSAIRVLSSTNVDILRPRVFDMFWSTARPPRYEQVFGIWIQDSKNVLISKGEVKNILGESGDNVYRSHQSDGIVVTGSEFVSIFSTTVKNTGEGYDFTGSDGNTSFEVADSYAIDNDSFGFKFANSAVNGLVTNSVAIRSGYAGFAFSGPSEPNLPQRTENITVKDCAAYDTGSNRRWPGVNVSGFLVLSGSYDLDFPQRIRILNSLAHDRQDRKTMKYGFFSQTGNNGLFNVDSFGHTIQGSQGFGASAYGFQTIDNQSTQILDCLFSGRAKNWYFDRSHIDGWSLHSLRSDLLDLQSRGIGCN